MTARRRELPSGVLTMLFTDIEGSTALLDSLGADRYAALLAEHHRVIRSSLAAHGGTEVDTEGDAFFAVFRAAADALAAAGAAQERLRELGLSVRMGVHTGTPVVGETGYVGLDVHHAARIGAAARGGQVVVSARTRELLEDVTPLRDLGLHRLKDLTEPQRLYQVGDGEFPPLKTLYRTNLPVQPSPLVGRERELEEVIDLVRTHRLVTLTGPGGIGKTRLALQAASELVDEFVDGTWWVSLQALRDPAHVRTTIAAAAPDREGKRALVLLDNFEHVLESAPAVSELLAGSRDVFFLCTSRERLGVTGEQEYVVPELEPATAVELFVTRARQLVPRFEPDDAVWEVCARLDGLPLAIELAAARVKVLSPSDIRDQLGDAPDLLAGGPRDAPARQRTLRATIDWSYELLDELERQLFARLALFRGSFSLAAADAVAGADVEGLSALVDKSLVQRIEDGRFFLLDTLRAYARERLGEDPATAQLRLRHATWYLAEAERVGVPMFETAVPDYVLEWFQREVDELRAALDTFRAAGALEEEIRLTLACYAVWMWRGHWSEGREQTASLVGRAGAAAPARLHWEAGAFAWRVGDLERGHGHARDALRLLEASGGDRQDIVYAHLLLGMTSRDVDDYERAAALAREIGDDGALSVIVNGLANLALEAKDYARARASLEEALELAQRAGADALLANNYVDLATVALATGDAGAAAGHYRNALPHLAARSHESLVWVLEGTAEIARRRGDPVGAARLLGAASALREGLGLSEAMYPPGEELRAAAEAAVRAELGDEAFAAAHAAGAGLDPESATSEANQLLA